MSWIQNVQYSWLQRLGINVIKSGPIPNHVAFIMDGNRRYATKNHLKERSDGHVEGFNKLAEALQWCLELGIKEVTVYAFSIENFKRSDKEVNTLLRLATDKFTQMLDEQDKLMANGICVRIIGNLSMLSTELRDKMCEAELLTRNNSKAVLNIAFAYTSRDEICQSIQTIVRGVEDDDLLVSDIDEKLLQRCMYSAKSEDPELLIRTSGESRLSDFMLWQVSATIIYFTDVLWPELTFWQLLAGMFYYQRHYSKLVTVKTMIENVTEKSNSDDPIQRHRIEKFLAKIDKQKYEMRH